MSILPSGLRHASPPFSSEQAAQKHQDMIAFLSQHWFGYYPLKSCITHSQSIDDRDLKLFQIRLQLPLLIARFHLPKIVEVST